MLSKNKASSPHMVTRKQRFDTEITQPQHPVFDQCRISNNVNFLDVKNLRIKNLPIILKIYFKYSITISILGLRHRQFHVQERFQSSKLEFQVLLLTKFSVLSEKKKLHLPSGPTTFPETLFIRRSQGTEWKSSFSSF